MRLPWKTKAQLLQEEIDFLRAGYAQLQNYVLMTGGGAPVQAPVSALPKSEGWDGAPIKDIASEAVRMYSTEQEEDIEFALQEGLIGEAEAARLLAEADAIANDIEIM